MIYQHLLVTLDLGPQSLYIARQCIKIAKTFDAQLSCLHVVEPPVTYTTGFAKRQKIIDKSTQLAKQSLQSLCQKLAYSDVEELIAVGSPQGQILSIAQAQKCDLILIGSHGVGGYTHVLGSTAHHVLSHAHCDVLIIQVSHLEDTLKQLPSQNYIWDNHLPENIPQPTSQERNCPPHGGSRHGFGENISRGPRPANRPRNFPYRGGDRQEKKEDDNSNDNK